MEIEIYEVRQIAYVPGIEERDQLEELHKNARGIHFSHTQEHSPIQEPRLPKNEFTSSIYREVRGSQNRVQTRLSVDQPIDQKFPTDLARSTSQLTGKYPTLC